MGVTSNCGEVSVVNTAALLVVHRWCYNFRAVAEGLGERSRQGLTQEGSVREPACH